MKQKNLIILFFILAVLIGLIFVKKNMKSSAPATEEIVDIIAPAISADLVREIVLELEDQGGAEGPDGEDEDDGLSEGEVDNSDGEGDVVHLVKEGDQWKDTTQYGVSANEKTIASILEKLDQLKGELRSNRKGILGDYGIGEEQAFHITLTRNDGQDVHVLVGTKNSGYQNNFVRLAGSNAVYLVEENLLATFGVRGEGDSQSLDTKKWADKRIAHMDVNNVVGISIIQAVNGKDETVIDLKQEMVDDTKKWQSGIPYEFNLNAAKIKKIAENLNNMYAREIIAPDVQGVFDAPGWVGTFLLESGDEVKIVRGNKDGDGTNYYMKQEGAAYYYLVPVSSFDSRETQQGGIFAENPLKVEENIVAEIHVKDIDNEKEFSAVKKTPPETDEALAEDTGEQPENKENTWESFQGDPIDFAKVQDVIGKIKAFSLEAVPKPAVSLKNALTLRIRQSDGAKEYSISKDVKSESGKECHILKVSGDDQGYCVSKSQITALQNTLP